MFDVTVLTTAQSSSGLLFQLVLRPLECGLLVHKSREGELIHLNRVWYKTLLGSSNYLYIYVYTCDIENFSKSIKYFVVYWVKRLKLENVLLHIVIGINFYAC